VVLTLFHILIYSVIVRCVQKIMEWLILVSVHATELTDRWLEMMSHFSLENLL
jgi:hypothetical protein